MVHVFFSCLYALYTSHRIFHAHQIKLIQDFIPGDGKSIYVKNLPLNITQEELELEFQKFGALKPGGVNLRNQKVRFPMFLFSLRPPLFGDLTFNHKILQLSNYYCETCKDYISIAPFFTSVNTAVVCVYVLLVNHMFVEVITVDYINFYHIIHILCKFQNQKVLLE
jgi:RNA recognition motif-containing protein